jgi:curved DNA-binding protein
LQTFAMEENGQLRPVTKTLQVKIPKGVTNGSVIRLAGQGETGSGQAKAGDLLLRITIAPDDRFRVEGHDLHTVVAVSPWEAALGAKIPVHTVDGAVTLAIPKGSQNGRKLRLRGKGIPQQSGVGGDIIVELAICVPAQLSPEEEKLFIELAKVSRFSPRSDIRQHCAAA